MIDMKDINKRLKEIKATNDARKENPNFTIAHVNEFYSLRNLVDEVEKSINTEVVSIIYSYKSPNVPDGFTLDDVRGSFKEMIQEAAMRGWLDGMRIDHRDNIKINDQSCVIELSSKDNTMTIGQWVPGKDIYSGTEFKKLYEEHYSSAYKMLEAYFDIVDKDYLMVKNLVNEKDPYTKDYSKNEFFVTEGRYGRYTDWGFNDDGHYDRCSIYPATKEDEEQDGFNFVGHGGSEGADFSIFNSLEEAFYNSQYKVSCWDKISIDHLSPEDTERAKKFIELAQNSKTYIAIQNEYAKMYDAEDINTQFLYYDNVQDDYYHVSLNNGTTYSIENFGAFGERNHPSVISLNLNDFNSVEEMIASTGLCEKENLTRVEQDYQLTARYYNKSVEEVINKHREYLIQNKEISYDTYDEVITDYQKEAQKAGWKIELKDEQLHFSKMISYFSESFEVDYQNGNLRDIAYDVLNYFNSYEPADWFDKDAYEATTSALYELAKITDKYADLYDELPEQEKSQGKTQEKPKKTRDDNEIPF